MGRVTRINQQSRSDMPEEIQTSKSDSRAPSGRVHPLVRRCRLIIYHPEWPTGVRTKWADAEESFDQAKKRAREKGCTFVTEYASPNDLAMPALGHDQSKPEDTKPI
jgi:hypothetical protein